MPPATGLDSRDSSASLAGKSTAFNDHIKSTANLLATTIGLLSERNSLQGRSNETTMFTLIFLGVIAAVLGPLAIVIVHRRAPAYFQSHYASATAWVRLQVNRLVRRSKPQPRLLYPLSTPRRWSDTSFTSLNHHTTLFLVPELPAQPLVHVELQETSQDIIRCGQTSVPRPTAFVVYSLDDSVEARSICTGNLKRARSTGDLASTVVRYLQPHTRGIGARSNRSLEIGES